LGFAGFGLGTFEASYITKDWDFYELLLPQILRGFSLMLCMVPINNLALGTLPPQQLKNASGLFNLTRNLGGALGLALINTLLNDRWSLHIARLHEAVSWGGAKAEETLAMMVQRYADLGPEGSLAAATRALANMARREGLVMAMGDVFYALTAIFMLLVVLTPLMRKPQRAVGGGH